jgi:orotate phosphoribosyltransferase-like protein
MSAIDKETGVDITLAWEHHKSHDGGMFAVSAYNATLASAGITNMMINLTAASNEVHSVFGVAVSGQVLVTVYEGITTATLGTTLTAYNMNRTKTNTPTGQYYLGATWSTNSESIMYQTIIPGGATVQTRVGSSGRSNTEWIFAPGKKYLIQVTNQAGATISSAINMTFYEMVD